MTRAQDVEALVRDRDPRSGKVDLHLYAGAFHGFDIASLARKKFVRLLPLIGPKATLLYHPVAATDAESRLIQFVADLTRKDSPSQVQPNPTDRR